MCLPISWPGDEQVLADVGQPRVAGGVGVVGDDRDPGGQRLLDGLVERGQADQRDPDPVDAGADRAVERVDHLADVAVLRAGPLVGAAEQLAGVRRAVLGRREERVGRHVVDERELVARARRRRCWTRALLLPSRRAAERRRARALARAARLEHHRGDAGGAAGQRRAAGDLPPLLDAGCRPPCARPTRAARRRPRTYLRCDIRHCSSSSLNTT